MGGKCHPLLYLEINTMKYFRNWQPVFIENSRVPVWLSKIAPLDIYAICLGPIVFARGTLTEKLRRHETIHWQQMLELLVIGHLVLYGWDWLKGCIKYRNNWKGYKSSGNKAYYRTRAEQEAYGNDDNLDYLSIRRRWQWLRKYSV
jgi:hypothetical protein